MVQVRNTAFNTLEAATQKAINSLSTLQEQFKVRHQVAAKTGAAAAVGGSMTQVEFHLPHAL